MNSFWGLNNRLTQQKNESIHLKTHQNTSKLGKKIIIIKTETREKRVSALWENIQQSA